MKTKQSPPTEIKTAAALRKFRESRGLTQAELGKMLDVTGHYVYLLESGKRTGFKVINMRLKLATF
jgi:transcriptional regulator with XRE-family HTH domain